MKVWILDYPACGNETKLGRSYYALGDDHWGFFNIRANMLLYLGRETLLEVDIFLLNHMKLLKIRVFKEIWFYEKAQMYIFLGVYFILKQSRDAIKEIYKILESNHGLWRSHFTWFNRKFMCGQGLKKMCIIGASLASSVIPWEIKFLNHFAANYHCIWYIWEVGNCYYWTLTHYF